jgi:hypothetical protein
VFDRLTSSAISDWQPMATCPPDGLFLVFQDGAMRLMFRTQGHANSRVLAAGKSGACRHPGDTP